MTANDIYQSLSFVFLLIPGFWISTSDSCSRPTFLYIQTQGCLLSGPIGCALLTVLHQLLYLLHPLFGTNPHDACSDGHSRLYSFYNTFIVFIYKEAFSYECIMQELPILPQKLNVCMIKTTSSLSGDLHRAWSYFFQDWVPGWMQLSW